MMRCGRFIFCSVCLAVLAAAPAWSTRAGDEGHLEERVRAAFVYNFVRFTEWPTGAFESPKAPLVVGVVGGGAICEEIQEAMKGKSIGDHPVKVQLFPPDQIGHCHVLYVSAGAGETGEMLKKVGSASVLTVGESTDFTDAGGVVRLYLEDGKQRFEVNVAAAERAKLLMSSKLLKLARTVRK